MFFAYENLSARVTKSTIWNKKKRRVKIGKENQLWKSIKPKSLYKLPVIFHSHYIVCREKKMYAQVWSVKRNQILSCSHISSEIEKWIQAISHQNPGLFKIGWPDCWVSPKIVWFNNSNITIFFHTDNLQLPP